MSERRGHAASQARQRGAGHVRAGARGTTSPGAVRTRLRAVPLPVLLGGMLLAGLCLLLALNTASAAQELRQRTLTDSNAGASDTEQQLVRDLASRQAPAALASAAAGLGLVPNPNPAFLRINADGSVTVLGSPTPASLPPPVSTPTSHPASPSPSVSKTAAGHPSKPATAVVTVTVTKPAPRPSISPTAKPSASTSHRATTSPSATATPGAHR